MRKRPFRGYCAAGRGNPAFSRSLKGKYCSAACAKHRFEHRRGNCAQCNQRLRRRQAKYCSITCQRERQFEELAAQLECGNYASFTNSRFLRRYLVRRFGECCSRCGWARRHPKTGRVPVEVEHIDGDYRNNRPENLTLLCPNCHSLTDTFRALNRGHGRPTRLGGRDNPMARAHVSKEQALTQPN